MQIQLSLGLSCIDTPAQARQNSCEKGMIGESGSELALLRNVIPEVADLAAKAIMQRMMGLATDPLAKSIMKLGRWKTL